MAVLSAPQPRDADPIGQATTCLSPGTVDLEGVDDDPPLVYDGALDAAERVLTLDTEGPSMAAAGKMAKYKDVIEFKSDDHRVLTSHMLGDEGKWHGFMTVNYRRKR